MWHGCESGLTLRSSAEVMNGGRILPLPHVFMARNKFPITYTKHTNKLCGQNAWFTHVKAGDTFINPWGVKGY
jgi:hypothetical protein